MKRKYFLFCAVFSGVIIHAQERQVLTSDSVELHLKVKGHGTPCLYVHGGPGSGSFWLEKFFGDYLEQNFQMIYLDQRGVGRSASPKNQNYSIDRMNKDFEEVRQALGIKKWITLGHSFGGILQMDYYEQYPTKILGMIMINCSLSLAESLCKSWIPKAAELTESKYLPPLTNSPDSILSSLMDLSEKLNTRGIKWKMAYSSPENEKLMDSTFNEIKNWNNDFSSVALTIKDYWKNYKKSTSSVRIPVLFFYGRTDWLVGPEHYKGIKFPKMILWGSNVGHMPFLENKIDLEKAIDTYTAKYNF
jgi:proline iminopeptidase